tara:strand:+ start:2041 stop:2253 length:213 start_codon:yes stop_codon:yes gene_type:complete
MFKTTFYYKLNDKYSIEYIHAIKDCKSPTRTKVYKQLVRKFNKGEISAYGYKNEPIINQLKDAAFNNTKQ